jgi:hypothetical protein
MKVQISKQTWQTWSVAQRQGGRRIETSEIEAFLDFDPVFPGWPPEDDHDEASPKRREPCPGEGIDLRHHFGRDTK